MVRLDGDANHDLAWRSWELEDRIGLHIEDRPGCYDSEWCQLSWPDRYCVYTLECLNYRSKDAFLEAMEFEHGHYIDRTSRETNHTDIPGWVWAAFFADARYYVGMTHDPFKRISEHIDHAPDVTTFTQYFPPKKILELQFVPTAQKAEQLERDSAHQIKMMRSDAFVAQK